MLHVTNSRGRFEAIPGKPHWWDGALKTPAIQEAVQELLDAPDVPRQNFTLTVMWPSESGSMSGWRVEEIEVPGRFATPHAYQKDTWLSMR